MYVNGMTLEFVFLDFVEMLNNGNEDNSLAASFA